MDLEPTAGPFCAGDLGAGQPRAVDVAPRSGDVTRPGPLPAPGRNLPPPGRTHPRGPVSDLVRAGGGADPRPAVHPLRLLLASDRDGHRRSPRVRRRAGRGLHGRNPAAVRAVRLPAGLGAAADRPHPATAGRGGRRTSRPADRPDLALAAAPGTDVHPALAALRDVV